MSSATVSHTTSETLQSQRPLRYILVRVYETHNKTPLDEKHTPPQPVKLECTIHPALTSEASRSPAAITDNDFETIGLLTQIIKQKSKRKIAPSTTILNDFKQIFG